MKQRYKIAYKGLKRGEHEFEFVLDNILFAEYPEGGISTGNVKASILLDKSESMMVLRIVLRGTVTTPCDRCLEDCQLPVNCEAQLTVKFSDEELPFEGDVMWINPAESELQLEQYLYESVLLSLPFRRVHPEDVHGTPLCNPDILRHFKIVSEDEFDRLTTTTQPAGRDPRWEKLGKLELDDQNTDLKTQNKENILRSHKKQ